MSIILVLSLFIIFKVSMFFWETFWIDVHYMVNNIVEVRHSSVWLSLWFVWRKICTKQKIHFVRLLMIGKGKNFIDGLIRFCVSKHLCFLGLFFFFFKLFSILGFCCFWFSCLLIVSFRTCCLKCCWIYFLIYIIINIFIYCIWHIVVVKIYVIYYKIIQITLD